MMQYEEILKKMDISIYQSARGRCQKLLCFFAFSPPSPLFHFQFANAFKLWVILFILNRPNEKGI
jgi:hypothetical protein